MLLPIGGQVIRIEGATAREHSVASSSVSGLAVVGKRSSEARHTVMTPGCRLTESVPHAPAGETA